MKNLKLFLVPLILGAIAGTLVLWAFDGFEPTGVKYLLKLFLKSLVPCVIVLAIFNFNRSKSQ